MGALGVVFKVFIVILLILHGSLAIAISLIFWLDTQLFHWFMFGLDGFMLERDLKIDSCLQLSCTLYRYCIDRAALETLHKIVLWAWYLRSFHYWSAERVEGIGLLRK